MILWNTANLATKRWYIYKILNLFGRDAIKKMQEMDNIASHTSLTILMDCNISDSEKKQWAGEEEDQNLGVEGYLY